jgi:hyperosmotically inducible periplasmic protein
MQNVISMRKLLTVFALAASIAACSAVSGRETAGEYVDDATITAKVRAAIIGEPSLKPLEVSVETMQDVVQLSGFVDSPQAKYKAGELALGIDGVRSVRNDLIVR